MVHLQASSATTSAFVRMMSRSTIYDRHESRRTRILRQKLIESRTPLERAMLGVPVVQLLVAPRKKVAAPVVQQQQQDHGDDDDDDASTNVFQSYRTTITSKHPTTSLPSLTSVTAAAAAGGILAEVFFGAQSQARVVSPFAATPVVLQQHATLAVARHSALYTTTTAMSQILIRSTGTTCLFFGTKALVEQRLQQTTNPSLALVGGAASAGAVLALVNQWMRMMMIPAVGMPQRAMSTEVAAATVYFSAYEAVKYQLTSQQQTSSEASTASTALAGAVAGVLSTWVHHASATAPSQVVPFAVQHQSAQRLSTAAFRAAPFHAALFVVYETISRALNHKSSC